MNTQKVKNPIWEEIFISSSKKNITKFEIQSYSEKFHTLDEKKQIKSTPIQENKSIPKNIEAEELRKSIISKLNDPNIANFDPLLYIITDLQGNIFLNQFGLESFQAKYNSSTKEGRIFIAEKFEALISILNTRTYFDEESLEIVAPYLLTYSRIFDLKTITDLFLVFDKFYFFLKRRHLF